MKYFFLLLLLFFTAHIIYAQDRPYSSNNKEAIKYFALANQSLDDRLFDEAIDNLQKAINEDNKFIEAHLLLADVLCGRWRYKEAIDQYRQVIGASPEFSRGVYYKLGDCEVHDARYADAQAHLEKYLAYDNVTEQTAFIAKKLISDCKFSIDAIK